MKKISCFSYKGGAGRSTLALNVVPFLVDELDASPEHPLILVDMDVDSCGITYFLKLEDAPDIDHYSVQAMFGVNGYIPQEDDEDIPLTEHVLFKHLCKVGKWFNVEDGSVLCLPAEPGAAMGGATNYDGRDNFVKEFLEVCKEYEVSGVLFDSAVGDQLTAVWSNRLSDVILCCMRPTKQFREGTQRFFDKFDDRIARDKQIIVIPNVVPTEGLTLLDGEESHRYPEYAKDAIKKSFEDNVQRNTNHYHMDMMEGELFGVPKIDRFMWQEGVLTTAGHLTETERVALDRYKTIAKLICNI